MCCMLHNTSAKKGSYNPDLLATTVIRKGECTYQIAIRPFYKHKPIAAAKKTISGIGTVSNALAMFFLK